MALLFALLLATVTPTVSPVITLAGRYSRHFRNSQVNGPDYDSDDIAEIVPVDAGHAYVRIHLEFYNGHSCALSGIAQVRRNALVYQGPPGDSFAGGPPCRLALRRKGETLSWSDGDNSCKAHCGERGSFLGGSLPWSSKRRITYVTRVKTSREYRQAMAEWGAREPSAALIEKPKRVASGQARAVKP